MIVTSLVCRYKTYGSGDQGALFPARVHSRVYDSRAERLEGNGGERGLGRGGSFMMNRAKKCKIFM